MAADLAPSARAMELIRRVFMQIHMLTQSSILARVRIAAMLFLGIFVTSGLVGTTWATTGGIPWQVGDVVVCYGGGNCNVVRGPGTSLPLLGTLLDGLLGSPCGAALQQTPAPPAAA